MTQRRLCVGLLALALAARARADDVHYQDYPVGNRAMGLAGAFTALSGDPSGLYYNPAGLLGTSRANVSVSTSLYGIEVNGPAGDDPTTSLSKNLRLSVVPAEVGGTWALGEIDPEKGADAVIGFDVLVPSARDGSTSGRGTFPDGWSDNRRESADQTLWIGGGGAWRFSDHVSAGASVFLLHRSVHLAERSSVFRDQGAEYHDAIVNLDASDDSILGRAGLRITTGGAWSFGLSLSTPNAPVRATGSARVTRVDWADAAKTTPASARELSADTSADPLSMRISTYLGAGIRAGAAYVVPKTLTVSCDVSAHLPVSYERFGFADPHLADELRLPKAIDRELVVNGACGAEWLFREGMSIAGGAYTDFSSAPALVADAEGKLYGDGRGVLPHVDLYGGSLAFGMFGDHSLTRFGLSLATGAGEDAAFQPGVDAWFLRRVRQTFAYVFVASTFRY